MMKTAKEVRKYMRRQEWYSCWKRFIKNMDLPLWRKIRLLRGKDVCVMMFCFDWRDTLQGYEYWENVAENLEKWYRDEE